MEIALFTFGYWGWGSSTPLLLEATQAVEEARGYAAPCFVDIRANRSVRAAGFRDRAFEQLAGPDRYVWMPALGNRRVAERTEGEAEIVDPRAAGDLLDLAMERARRRQRLLYFCACELPGTPSQPGCHRTLVTELVLSEARRRGLEAGVGEWPGGKRRALSVEIGRKDFTAVTTGRSVRAALGLADVAGLPWGSRVTARHDGQMHTFIAGPGRPSRGALVIPQLLWGYDDLELEWRRVEEIDGLGWQTSTSSSAR